MKKLLTSIILALMLSITNAQATDSPDYMSQLHAVPIHSDPVTPTHHHSHDNIVPIIVVAGIAVIAGVAIYEIVKESRWTANESGIVYRF